MDREVKENYQVVIQAKDMAGQMGGLSGTTTVSITLSDVNDSPPRFANRKTSRLPLCNRLLNMRTPHTNTHINKSVIDCFIRSLSCIDSFRVTAVESTEIGGAIGRIKADDPDVGRNAEMEYSIVGGHDIFNIITEQTTQEGVIIIKKVSLSFDVLSVCHILCI